MLKTQKFLFLTTLIALASSPVFSGEQAPNPAPQGWSAYAASCAVATARAGVSAAAGVAGYGINMAYSAAAHVAPAATDAAIDYAVERTVAALQPELRPTYDGFTIEDFLASKRDGRVFSKSPKYLRTEEVARTPSCYLGFDSEGRPFDYSSLHRDCRPYHFGTYEAERYAEARLIQREEEVEQELIGDLPMVDPKHGPYPDLQLPDTPDEESANPSWPCTH